MYELPQTIFVSRETANCVCGRNRKRWMESSCGLWFFTDKRWLLSGYSPLMGRSDFVLRGLTVHFLSKVALSESI